MNLEAIEPKNRESSEKIICNSKNKILGDFWQWAYSDLIGNTERGVLAEYLVALACNVDTNPRISWNYFDLELEDKTKIEVKSSGYLQSWKQASLSEPKFGIAKTRAWDTVTGLLEKGKKRHADIYVFALHAHEDKSTINPLNTAQWEFYILERNIIDINLGEAKQITLKKIKELKAVKSGFDDLFTNINDLIANRNSNPASNP